MWNDEQFDGLFFDHSRLSIVHRCRESKTVTGASVSNRYLGLLVIRMTRLLEQLVPEFEATPINLMLALTSGTSCSKGRCSLISDIPMAFWKHLRQFLYQYHIAIVFTPDSRLPTPDSNSRGKHLYKLLFHSLLLRHLNKLACLW